MSIKRETLPVLTYHPPYVHKPAWFWSQPMPEIPFTLDVPADLIEVHNALVAYLMDWLKTRGVLDEVPDGKGRFTFVVKKGNHLGGANNYLVEANPRIFVIREKLDTMIRALSDNDVRSIMTDLQTLVISITTGYPDTLVNIIINKTYRSLDAIPPEGAEMTWDEVHGEFPFLWIFFYLQSIIYRLSDLRKVLHEDPAVA